MTDSARPKPERSESPEAGIQFRITSEPDRVALVGQCVRALSSGVLGERVGFELELATCEVINNVIEHAYSMAPGKEIVVDWLSVDDMVEIRVHDWGKPMPRDLLSGSLPDVDSLDVEDLPEGGFGIGLVNRLTDRIDLHSDRGGRNTLTIYRGPRHERTS